MAKQFKLKLLGCTIFCQESFLLPAFTTVQLSRVNFSGFNILNKYITECVRHEFAIIYFNRMNAEYTE